MLFYNFIRPAMIFSISCLNDSETQERGLQRVNIIIKKNSGEHAPGPSEACAFG